jgi:hypothetical protein
MYFEAIIGAATGGYHGRVDPRMIGTQQVIVIQTHSYAGSVRVHVITSSSRAQ